MDVEPSLAKLIRDYGDRWEVEKIVRGTEWIVCQADSGGFIRVIAAHDLHALRYKIEQAEREEPEEHEPDGGSSCPAD